MVDITNFIISLKCSWIKRLITSDSKPWLDIFIAINGQDIVNKIFDFGIAYIFDYVVKENNAFWQDVFNSWLTVMKSMDGKINENDFFRTPLWYNPCIKVGNEGLFMKTWYNKGIATVGDMFDDESNFLSVNALKQRYNFESVCIMQYNSVISAISNFMKIVSIKRNCVKIVCKPSISFYYEPILLYEKCTKVIYRLLNESYTDPNSISRWNSELSPHRIQELLVKDVFKVCFKITTDSTAQWLQYRILHRILPVNYYLKKINLVSSDSCTFCKQDVETIQHIFIDCEKIMSLWSSFSLHIYVKTKERVGFNLQNVLFGDLPLTRRNKVLNFLILYTKQYIFSSLKQNKLPNIYGLLSHLKFKFNIEKHIAIQNCDVCRFEKLWSLWKNIFDF